MGYNEIIDSWSDKYFTGGAVSKDFGDLSFLYSGTQR